MMQLNGSIADSYKEALYSQAYSSYSSGDYQSAIPTFQKLVGMDEAYRGGSAAITWRSRSGSQVT